MKKQTAKEKQYDLVGIEAIQAFVKNSAATILFTWKRYGFPIVRREENGTFTWVADSKAIKDWFGCRKITPKTATEAKLISYHRKQNAAAGEKFINRKLNSITEIENFTNKSTTTILDWYRFYDQCPIEKKDGVFVCDGQELFDWATGLGLAVNFRI